MELADTDILSCCGLYGFENFQLDDTYDLIDIDKKTIISIVSEAETKIKQNIKIYKSKAFLVCLNSIQRKYFNKMLINIGFKTVLSFRNGLKSNGGLMCYIMALKPEDQRTKIIKVKNDRKR